MPISASWARRRIALTATCVVAAGVWAQTSDVDELLARVGERVRTFYDHAQSVVCTERVTYQPIASNLMPEGFPRVLEYELRVEWDRADGDEPEARMTRELLRVNGRTPRPKDEPKCVDPKSASPDPLTMLLPRHREEYVFGWARNGRQKGVLKDGRTLLVEYQQVHAGPLEDRWDDKDCLSISVPVRTRGRVWIDAITNDVMRLEESLTTTYEYRLPPKHAHGDQMFWVFQRMDTSVRYRPVAFRDPEEIMLLPESMDSLMVVQGAQSYRRTQTFNNYRRFLTAGRLVK